jgi:RNA polymerase sigma-70 factor, ECF subfamily
MAVSRDHTSTAPATAAGNAAAASGLAALDATATPAAVAAVFAGERLRILAGLIGLTQDWELAEDCVQDAAERAIRSWTADGIPDNPAAWLATTARRRALDLLRRRQTERQKLREVQAMARLEADLPDEESGPYGDDRLKLLFACCHPALPLAGRVALTLKTVAGLSTREIARAFLVSETTMRQRLLRARNKIVHAGIGFRVPEPHRLADRVDGVLAVVYLLFNEGYAATEGDELIRDDLAREALQLAALLAKLLPDNDEVHGMRALVQLQHSRRAARTDGAGQPLTMEEQDRRRWSRELINAGLDSLATARSSGRPPGYYRLQAEIASRHAVAATAEDTDWATIVGLYDALLRVRPSPVAALNRVVAVAMRDGAESGLSALDAALAVHPNAADYPLLPAIRADLLRRAGRWDEAAAAYRAAIERAGTQPERRLLRRRLAELTDIKE